MGFENQAAKGKRPPVGKLPDMRQFFDLPSGKKKDAPTKEAKSAAEARQAAMEKHTQKFGAGGDAWEERMEDNRTSMGTNQSKK